MHDAENNGARDAADDDTRSQEHADARDDARDAARWRALLASERIRVLGSAGMGRPGPYKHLGLEIWTVYPEGGDTTGAQRLLTEYADALVEAGKGR